MQIHRLTAHPSRPADRVSGVQMRWQYQTDGSLFLRWRIDGARKTVLPPFAGRGRADDLWKTTCLELFVDRGGGAYREFNFSPSGRWAAYDFSDYRVRAGNAELRDPPVVAVERGDMIVAGSVRLPSGALAGAGRGALAAVVEEEGGVISFWASAHNAGKPDFHDRTCFTIDFAPPRAP